MHLPTILLFSTLHLLPVSSLALNLNLDPPTNLLTLPTSTNLTLLPLTLTAPSAHCVKITDPPMLGLNPSNCDLALPIACGKLTDTPAARLVHDKWIWTELPGCSLGYYLPDEAAPPFLFQCEGALGAVVELCATNSRFNAGEVNVETMPDFGGDGTAVVEGAVRYVMAPERLTLP